MNDELSGQLTREWVIPQYAYGMIWLQTEIDQLTVEGEYGLFELSVPASTLAVRWGNTEGPILAQLSWMADCLGWDGRVCAGGYVDAVHTDSRKGVSIISMGGQPLKQTARPYSDPTSRLQTPYTRPNFHAALAAELPETMSTWLVPSESPLAEQAQRAIIHNLRVYLWGRLADDAEGWGEHVALPLVLEAVTLFAT